MRAGRIDPRRFGNGHHACHGLQQDEFALAVRLGDRGARVHAQEVLLPRSVGIGQREEELLLRRAPADTANAVDNGTGTDLVEVTGKQVGHFGDERGAIGRQAAVRGTAIEDTPVDGLHVVQRGGKRGCAHCGTFQ